LRFILYIYIIGLSVSCYGQVKDTIPPIAKDLLIKEGDFFTIQLDEVELLSKQKFKSQVDVRYYYWLRKKVYKAYPYAVIASQRLDSLTERLKRIKRKSRKRKYTKIIQKYLEGEFTTQLKKMTHTEGRILIKLIHRQTGETAYRQVKELRSGWRAFWYNTTANLFRLSLKTEYHPEHVNEDFLVEDILQRAFINDQLEEYPPKVEFNFNKIYTKNKGLVDVEEYKKMFAKIKKKRLRREKRKN